jgi:hypothetical protein
VTPFVPNCECDIFISYSHANNHEDWISIFRKKLEDRLRERVPPGVQVFFDTNSIQGNADLTPEITQTIRKTAILVPIISRSYLTRPWCIRECEEFLAATKDHPVKGRIFPVRYDDVSPAEYQKVLGEKIGYEFYAKSVEDKYEKELDPHSDLFKARLNTLRMEIGAKLEAIKHEAESSAPSRCSSVPTTQPPRPTSIPTLFLAEPAPGLADHRDQLVSFFKGIGFEVLRPGERFQEQQNFEGLYTTSLRQADVFVQVLGRKFLPSDDDAVPSWDQWQFQKAQKEGKPTFRWFNKYGHDGNEIDLAKLDADHRAFVTEAGVWNCDLKRFFDIVRAEIEQRHHARRQREIALTPNGPRPHVVLRSDRVDKRAAEEIGERLSQLQCDWTRVSDKDIQSLEEFAKEFIANGVLVVYRACAGKWVLTRLQELRKFLSTEVGRRWACALWRAPVDEEDAISCSVDGVHIIKPEHPERLTEFVGRVRASIGELEAKR